MQPTLKLTTSLLLTLAALAALTGGCATEQANPDDDVDLRDGGTDETGWCDVALQEPTEEELCVESERVAFLNLGQTCVAVSGEGGQWAASQLFGTSHPYLDRFCSYEWRVPGKTNAPPDLSVLDPISDHDPQCNAVGADGSPWASAVDEELAEVFREHLDHVAEPDLATGLLPEYVDIFVVDSKAPGSTNAYSKHGDWIGAIIEDIACDGQHDCKRLVKHSLAFPYHYGPNGIPAYDATGGSFGRQSDLGVALDDVLQQMQGSIAKRTVVNFSGGWDMTGWNSTITPANQLDVLEASADDPKIPTGVRSVHAALVALRCAGALPIVAAGNRIPGSCIDGPKRPAEWENLPALSAAQCQELGFATSEQPPSHAANPSYAPLVYSVGGIGYEGQRLANARASAMPRLAAPGQNGLAPFDGGFSNALSGTSVAAAGVSATAALIWSYIPDLPASTVMDMIYTSGLDVQDELTGQTMLSDYGLVSGEDVHQIGVCSAVEAACAHEGAACVLNCAPGNPDTAPYEGFSVQQRINMPDLEEYQVSGWSPVSCEDICTGELSPLVYAELVDMTAPITSQAAPTYIPDPTDPSCPACDLHYLDLPNPIGDLLLSLDSAYANEQVDGVWLYTFLNATSPPNTFYLGTGAEIGLSATSTTTVTINTGSGGIPSTALVRMKFLNSNDRHYYVDTAIPVF